MTDSSGGDPKNDWKLATKAVRGGVARSSNMETAEAMYLTSGFTYDSAEQAAAVSYTHLTLPTTPYV